MKSGIDIIIPVYNREALLPRTLESIERQTLPPDAVILVDNNSSDSSAEVCRLWQQKMNARGWTVKVTSESTPGAAAARNRGLQLSTSEFVMHFDSDDTMSPRHIEDFASALRRNPGADIAGRSVSQVLLNGKSRKGLFTAVMPDFFNIFTSTLATQRYAVRRSLLNAAGLWDESVKAWNDIELGFRLLLLKPEIITVPGSPSVTVYSQVRSITGVSVGNRAAACHHAINCMRQAALKASRTDLLTWLDVKEIILAAELRQEGATDEARKLLDNILARTPAPRRMKFLYRYHLRFGRFTWAAALAIL